MSLKFDVEWNEAPGVEDVILAPTWGRLAIELTAQGAPLFATSAIHETGLRKGVYGAWFPLARWLVSNYWNLLFEVPLSERLLSARTVTGTTAHVRWMQRHNILCAGDSPRLVTRSHARQQRESRAFAAELLAPAAELARKLGGVEVSENDLVNLSNEFGVGPQLIRYQIENHKLAVVSEQ